MSELKQGTTFKESDIKNKSLLAKEIEEETMRIYKSPVGNRGRSFLEIKKAVTQGKTAEVWLTERGGYSLSSNIYHDLVDSDGEFVEVKAFTNVKDSSDRYVKEALDKIRKGGWNRSKYMLLFRYSNGLYTFLEKIQIR